MGLERKETVLGAGGLGLAVVAGALALAGRRQVKAWRAADDPSGPDLMKLPEGKGFTVTASDGAALAVAEAGEGPIVVCAHGWTETSGIWAGVARQLVDSGHRVVVYDQRGHGRSTVGSDGITVARLGADLADILEAIDARDAVLVGHSMGGMTVMALVAADPSLVARRARALVLVSTAAAGMGRGRGVDAVAGRLLGSPFVGRAFAGSLGPRLSRASVGRNPRYSHLAATAAMFGSTLPATRAEAFAAMAVMDLRDGLAACPVPATVVVGSRDQLTPPRRAREIAKLIPGAELVVIPDAGHQLTFEEPDRLAEIIAAQPVGAGQPRSAVGVPSAR